MSKDAISFGKVMKVLGKYAHVLKSHPQYCDMIIDYVKMFKEEEVSKDAQDSNSVVDENGTKKWYKDRKLHREDGPAVERANGTLEWYKDGKLHRDDGPAVERANGNGTLEWYKNGELHREDGPAFEYADGTKKWYKDGKLHREDGPAVVYTNGTLEWYKDGKLHRKDGPAVVDEDGTLEWYKDGIEYVPNEEKSWDEWTTAASQYYNDECDKEYEETPSEKWQRQHSARVREHVDRQIAKSQMMEDGHY